MKSRASALTTVTSVSSPPAPALIRAMITSSPSPHSSYEHAYHQVPIRLVLSRCILSRELNIPLFVEKCVRFIEEHGLALEGLYRISGYKNQVELVITKLSQDPSFDLNSLQIPVSAVATAFKDMMRKLDEPILSLEQFDDCQTLTSTYPRPHPRPLTEPLFVFASRSTTRTKLLPSAKSLTTHQ